jgi:hypothetical protein
MFDLHLSDRDREELHDIVESLREITSLLRRAVLGISATTGTITQIGIGEPMIIGVKVGLSGTFQVTWNGAIKQGSTTWKTGDPSVTLTASPDGDTTKVIATVATGETLPSFGLTASAVSSDGSTITSDASIPVLANVPPATGGTIDQLA